MHRPQLPSLAGAVAMAILTGCSASQPNVIALPEGSAASGERAFVALECTSCHTVAGKALPDPEELGPVTIVLGEEAESRSYADLVTAIINPSHHLATNPHGQKLSEYGYSLMPIYNDVMSVTELVDIVTFLSTHYGIKRPPYRYPEYAY